jgi:hypothetical protein
VGIAARAALRVAPAVARLSAPAAKEFRDLSSAVYRAVAIARVVARTPGHPDELFNSANAAVNATLAAFESAAPAIDAVADPVIGPAVAASAFAAADSARAGVASAAVDTVLNAAGAYSDATYRAAVWGETSRDASLSDELGLVGMLDSPLWASELPSWATADWTLIQSSWPSNENWDVWIAWYEARLRGGSGGEDYELVFASVPQEEWDKGPATANAWIKAHLSVVSEKSDRQLPLPLENVPSIDTYAVNAAGKVRSRSRRPECTGFSVCNERGGSSALAVCLAQSRSSPNRRHLRKEVWKFSGRTLSRLPGTL